MRFVDIKNDVAFRKIFGNKKKTKCLISFLNAVLELEGSNQVVRVTMIDPYRLPVIKGEIVKAWEISRVIAWLIDSQVEKSEIARYLLFKGLEADFIAETIGWSIEEIQKIEDEWNVKYHVNQGQSFKLFCRCVWK